MKLGMQVGLGPDHIVLDGNTAALPQQGAEPPIFSPYLTSGWIKMPLGTEVGLGPDDICLLYTSPSPRDS